jgi:hypothetical protein
MITTSIDVSGMEKVLRQISVMSMRPMREVTTSEALAVLQTCLDRTELTKAGEIESKLKTKYNQYSQDGRFGTRSAGSFPKISVASRNGNIWLGLPRPATGAFSRNRGRRGSGVWHLVNKHYERDADWSLFEQLNRERLSELKRRTTEWIARRGMPKASWYWIAEEIGYALKAASVVLNAAVRGRALKEVAHAQKKEEANGFTIICRNSSIAAIKKDAEGILSRTLDGRVKYFRQNLERGVFDSMKNVERSYPNLVRVRAA